MDNPMDEFEDRLQSLRPREPSANLRRNIAAHLSEAPAGATWGTRRCAIFGGLLAACLVIGIAVWFSQANVERHPPAPAPAVYHRASQPDFADAPPTLSVYDAALLRSPDELDALLEKQSKVLLPPERNSAWSGNRACIQCPLL